VKRAKSSRCLRRVTGAQADPKVAVYSAMSGRKGRLGRRPGAAGRPNTVAGGGVLSPLAGRP
jgi:hypothetical protein